MQNLSVGRRSINDLEERTEVELSTVTGALKATANIGVIGLERLGNPTIAQRTHHGLLEERWVPLPLNPSYV